MSGKRNSAYFRERLKSAHPEIYRDLVAGRIPSVRAAAAKAGLIRLPNRVDALKRDWTKSSKAERLEFIKFVKAAASSKRPVSVELVDADGFLLRTTIDRIDYIMRTRGLKMGMVMREMGLPALSSALAFARYRSSRPRPYLRNALSAWLISQRRV
jgi:hypothetical protein